VRLSETLLGFGARLVFGHDWRYGGVMEAISQAALRYWPVDDANSPPLIKNFVPWPDNPQLKPDVQRRRDIVKSCVSGTGASSLN
jgi:hypothetical protein